MKKYTKLNRLIRSDAIQMILEKLDDGTFQEMFGDWKWIFSYSWRYKWIVVLYTFLGIFSSSLSLGAAYVSRILINIIVEKQYENLGILIAAMVFSTVFSVLISSAMSRFSLKVSIYVNNAIQADIFDQIIDAKWTELNKFKGGDLLNRFNGDVSTISGNAIGWIPSLVINVYTFIITFVVMARMDWIMAAIAILSAPFLMVMSRFIMRNLRRYRKRVLELNSRMMSFEAETFFNFDNIKSFGIIPYYSRELRKYQKEYKDYSLDYNKFQIKANILMTMLSSVVSMTAFLYCIYRLWTGQILYGDMMFFIQQREALTSRFNSLVSTIPGMVNSAISAHRVRELVNLEREEHNPESVKQMQKVAGDGITVQMEDVAFSYGDGTQVCSGGYFVARPGEIVALLGSSGGGKTTMLRMLLGLLNPAEGSVTLQGSDGQKVAVNADMRVLFSYVPQNNNLPAGSILDSMRMVREDATEEEVVSALKTACAWEFVEKLPQGIHTVLGDNGKGISTGQAQRISIARALLRDAPIMMLDEATSALDYETEQRVLRNIIEQKPNKTCIVSTHRPGVLEQCQRIYRISDRRLCELTPEEIQQAMQDFAEGGKASAEE